jgi:hypothetical protein
MKTANLWRSLGSIFVLWLALGLRLYQLDFQSMWWDEGHSIFVASHPIRQIPSLPAMDVHPPGYFSLLHLWMALGGRSEFALRYLSVLFSLLTVALLWRFAASLVSYPAFNPSPTNHQLPTLLTPLSSPYLPALLAALLAALSPMYVAYGQEVRSYAMITFLALGSTYTLWQIILRQRRGTERNSALDAIYAPKVLQSHLFKWLLLYILLTTASFYTHYFTIFLIFFQNLVWLVWVLAPGQNNRYGHRKMGENSKELLLQVLPNSYFWVDRLPRLSVWLISQLGILLLFIPQLTLAVRQVSSYTNPNLIPPTLTYFINRSWQAYTVGLTIDPTPAQWGMWGITGVLLASWLILAISLRLPWNGNRRQHRSQTSREQKRIPLFNQLFCNFTFLLFWPLIPLAAYFIILQRQPSFEPRYMMLVTPALFLLLALGLGYVALLPLPYASRTTHHAPRFPLYVLLPIPLLIFIAGLYHYYTNEIYFKDDSAGVAAWLAAESTAKDIVYTDVPHPFHYYADRRNIPAPIRYLFVDIHTAADILTREATGRDRLFWVTWWGSDTDPRSVIPFLAEKAGQSLGQHDFKGYRVQWFDLPAKNETGFSLPTVLTPINATFGDVLRLDGLAFGGGQNSPTTPVREPVWATLHFTLLRQTDVNYKVSLRLRGTNGQIMAQLDRELLNDRHSRTSAWPLTDPALNQAINVYMLPVATDTPPGPYQLETVVYNAAPPYPSEGVTGHQHADGVAAILGQITVVP